ncbi:DUF4167 domain-containing protein [Rhodovibrio salinarum]|uniref:DUF4167 domain-containing protein n=1 Tax=Rhodovibrio salinarum TaxID=1087 RepID=A0A934V075_9PROT|nr:DUF4167 domain-containing protein [Rhodovibrio salinarum]MBK1697139.1 DUF4167 domain-containing protein [Rhodovibrio salinarum]
MKQGSSGGGRRPRGRSGGGGGGGRKNVPLKNQNFDSNGPDVRVRGNATQVYEKYLALARDASSAGDRVIAESYYQHAEHYYRIINENTDPSYEDLYGREPNGYDGQDEEDYEDDGARQQARGTRQERRERYEQDERRRQQPQSNGQGYHVNGGGDAGEANGAPQPAADGADAQGSAEADGGSRAKRGRGRPRRNKNAQGGDGNGESNGEDTAVSDAPDTGSGQPADNASSEDSA